MIQINIEVSAEPVEIVVILDKSGSMEKLRNDVIGGYNNFVESQRALGDDAYLRLVQFSYGRDHSVRQRLSAIEPLTRHSYSPNGGTALNDAIVETLLELRQMSPRRAIIAIITDGEENSSKRYSRQDARREIEAAEERGWQVMYLGANQDAVKVGESLGSVRNSNFAASGVGVRSAMASVDAASKNYRGCL